ncbi:MAG: redoxin domain-containing protein [Bacteroidetes bacterium]|nr:redoxin domain-containing protein [Bacteroidota bacterium]
MKKMHHLTTAGIGLGAASVATLFSGYTSIASALALVAYFFTLSEVPKLSSWYQFVMLAILGPILGYTLDHGHARFPFFTVIIFITAILPLFRLIFYKAMLHTKLLWAEPPLILLCIGAYVCVNIFYPQGWQAWFYPVLPMAFTAHLVSVFVIEGRSMKKIKEKQGDTRVGSPAPDFELQDQTGNVVRLSDLKEKRSVLLLFIRGDWCPACHMMLRTYGKSSAKLREKNILLLGIGPDDMGTNKAMAEKLGIEFRILADPGQKTSIAYGTHIEKESVPFQGRSGYEEGLPMPSTFLICDNGIIRYRSRADNAGEFLNPEIIFDVLEKIGVKSGGGR